MRKNHILKPFNFTLMKDLHTLLTQLQANERAEFSFDEAQLTEAIAHETEVPTSWIIRVVTMLGAWIAGGCFFGVISLLGIFDSKPSVLALGIILMIGAVLAFRSMNKQIFIAPLALTASITGQMCVGYGLLDTFEGKELNVFFCIEIAIQLLLFIATHNNTQKFIAVLAFNFFVVCLLFNQKWSEGIHFVLGINALLMSACILWEEKILAKFKQIIPSYQPLTAGLTVSFLVLIFVKWALDEKAVSNDLFIYNWWISAVFILLSLLLLIYKVSLDFKWNLIYTLPVVLVLTPLIGSPGILGGILVLLLGFYHNSKWFIGMGILALTCFISLFYYNLQLTLWVKSFILMASGLLFLAVFWILNRISKKMSHTPHA